MFKNAIFFRILGDWSAPSAPDLEAAMDTGRFQPCGATQRQSVGWVEPRGEKHGALVEVVGGQFIFKLMTETKMLPGSVVKDKLAERMEKIEAETGRKPGAKAKRELKEEIEQELLPQAFTKKGATLVWLSPKAKLLVVEAGSAKKADAVVTHLVELFGQVAAIPKLARPHTQMSPAGAMSTWLVTQEAPFNFSVDRECELKGTDGEKATVRYSRHNLDLQEVVEHIQTHGKAPTKLAMTHDSRVSYVLTDDLALKKVELVGVQTESGAEQESGFDADVALVTGELLRMIPDLLEALGGEIDSDDEADADEDKPAGAGNATTAQVDGAEEAASLAEAGAELEAA